MSSFFSDPYFGRGQTLLSGEAIELNGAVSPNTAYPVAGQNIVGDVKVFNDTNPRTAQTYSNQLVYCMACRYTGANVADGSTLAGRVFPILADGASFSTLALAADMTAGKRMGVFDEYFTGALRTNDIVWLTVSGPTLINTTQAVIAAGSCVKLDDVGSVVAVNVLSGGTGATSGALIFTGGGFSTTAAGTFVAVSGVVTSATVVTPGIGYTSAPVVTIGAGTATFSVNISRGGVLVIASPVTPGFAIGLHRAAVRRSGIANTAGTDAYGNSVSATAATAAEDGMVDVGLDTAANQNRARIHFSGNVLSGSVL